MPHFADVHIMLLCAGFCVMPVMALSFGKFRWMSKLAAATLGSPLRPSQRSGQIKEFHRIL
jgi:hypothetical protein